MKSLLRLFPAILFLSGAVLYGSENGNRAPEGLSDSDWSGIQVAYERNRHAITAEADGTYLAHNPGQAWVTRFDGRGFMVTPDEGDWKWGLELEGYDEVTEVQMSEGKLSYVRRDGLVEWFINDERGLEQGWTFSERPKEAGLDEGEFLSFLFENWGSVINEEKFIARIRLFNSELEDRKR